MAVTDPTDAEPSQVDQTDPGAPAVEVEGPQGRDRLIWLAAGAVFAAGGLVWIFNGSDPPVIAVIFIAVALACFALAAGFTRRR